MLLVVVLFKTFYQGKNWKAKRMAEEAYFVANQYARNNGTNLHPYLSRAFRKEVRQLPGLLPLSMQTATRGGTITGAESVGLREITRFGCRGSSFTLREWKGRKTVSAAGVRKGAMAIGVDVSEVKVSHLMSL